MKLQIVAMRDDKLEAFGQPFYVQATGQAIRSFQDEINNPQSEIHKHPEDYDLYHLGEWENTTAEFKIFDNPKLLSKADQLKH